MHRRNRDANILAPESVLYGLSFFELSIAKKQLKSFEWIQ